MGERTKYPSNPTMFLIIQYSTDKTYGIHTVDIKTCKLQAACRPQDQFVKIKLMNNKLKK